MPKKPWIGTITKSSHSNMFGGYYTFFQVPYSDGFRQRSKKFYYDQGDDLSVSNAMEKAKRFHAKKSKELKIEKDDKGENHVSK